MNSEWTVRTNSVGPVGMAKNTGVDASVDIMLGKDFMAQELLMLSEITKILDKYDYHKTEEILNLVHFCIRRDIFSKVKEVSNILTSQTSKRGKGLGLCDTSNPDVLKCSVLDHMTAISDCNDEKGGNSVKLKASPVSDIDIAVAGCQEIQMDSQGNFMTDVQLIADRLGLTAPTKDGLPHRVESVDELIRMIDSRRIDQERKTVNEVSKREKTTSRKKTVRKAASNKTTTRKKTARR